MNLEQLIEQFELVTNTEEGLDKFRKYILDLAIQGRLTEQDFEAESAKKLVDRIKEKKHKLYEEGKVRKPKDLDPIIKDDEPFGLPKNWKWCRMDDITEVVRGITFPASEKNQEYADGLICCLKTSNVQEEVVWDDVIYVDEKYVKSEEKLLREGDILISMANSYELVGKVALVRNLEKRSSLGGFISAIRTLGINNKYLFYLLRSEHIQSTFRESSSQTTNIANLSLKRILPILFPIPPLEEQQRIVQKIEALFSQVDELEQKVQQNREVDEHLQVAVLDDLQSAETPQASRQSWKRLTDHFEQIYRKPEHIDQLKQAILNEAVRGRLVPQDPNDEPAEKLLERIKEKKQRLYNEGEIRKPKDLPEITDEEIPYELPEGWAWCRLGEILRIETGATPTKSAKKYYEGGKIAWFTSKATNNWFAKEPQDFITQQALDETNCDVFPKGSLIMAMYGQGKTRGQISELLIEGATNQALAGLIPYESSKQAKRYVKLFLFKSYNEIRLRAEGGAQPNLNLTKIRNWLVPLPSVGEEQRIVEKIDELFAWCDDLKEKLSRSQQTDQRLLAALVNGALEEDEESKETEETTIYQMPNKRVINQKISKVSGMSTTDVQAGMMARILNGYERYQGEKAHLGRTKMEKVCHVIESHSGIDLGRKPKRMQFGSADYGRLRGKVEPRADKLNWFTAEEKSDGVHYHKGTQFHEPFQKLGYKLIDKADEIDRIIELFVPLSTRDAEVRQTVYAAWHDLIAYGKEPTNEEIVIFASTEKYWAKEKEDIPKEEFYEAIDWLRENDLVPDGKGKITVKEES